MKLKEIDCLWCDASLDVVWVETTELSDPEPTYTPGRVTGHAPDCQPRCPICRRPAADIHGPHCGPIILDKLGDLSPCTIARADCGPRWTA